MSIYDNRVEPAYRSGTYGPEYWNNPHIVKWWTPAHDDFLVEQMHKHQWHWYWYVTDQILAVTPTGTIEA